LQSTGLPVRPCRRRRCTSRPDARSPRADQSRK
jgi:hypothetical protein